MKANNHPLVRDLRRILDKHGLTGAVLVAIRDDGYPIYVSAGKTKAQCDAIGPILKNKGCDYIANQIEMKLALLAMK